MPKVSNKRPLKVFLCHASADKPKVRELYRTLKRRGMQPWLDAEELLPGQDWALEIPKALEESDAIIIFLSKGSASKEGYVQKEIKFALDRALEMPDGRIFIIPARLEPCDLPRGLSKYQWVDLFDEAGYLRMIRSLKFRASQLERATVELLEKDIDEERFSLEKAIHEKRERETIEMVEKARIVGKSAKRSKRALKVFLCHASADRDEVRELYLRLTAAGVDTWLDVESLLPGQKWKVEIPKAIRNSDIVLVCLSKEAISKDGFLQKEIREALDIADEKPEEEIFIIPARLEECDVPFGLEAYQLVNLFEEDGYEKLIRSLKARAKEVDATLLPFEIPRIIAAKSKAVQLERDGNYSRAIEAYTELKKLAPTYSGLDAKISQLQKKPYWPLIIVGGITVIVFLLLNFNSLFLVPEASSTPTVHPSATATFSISSITPTTTRTPVLTLSPTLTSTFTPIPTESILLQQNFEDNNANGWEPNEESRLNIDEESGNHYLSLTGSGGGVSAVFYENDETSHWIDYAFESRIRFVSNNDILVSICIHVDDYTYYKLRISGPNVTFWYRDKSGSDHSYGVEARNEFVLNQWYTIRLEIRGLQAVAYLDNVFLAKYELKSSLHTGQGGIGYQTRGGDEIFIDDIKVWSLE